MTDKYKPSGIFLISPPYPVYLSFPAPNQITEHGGKREDGQPDKRTQQSEFAYGKVDPHKAGQQGGSTTGSTTGAPGNAPGEFAHGTVDPHEAGRAGGSR